jgi:polysaccharide export outer membrane protein
MPTPRSPLRWPAAALSLLAVAACGRTAPYIRVEDLAIDEPTIDPAYRIAVGDVLGVRVWNQTAMSVEKVRVREDGKITLPFLQDVDAAGTTPADLSTRLQGLLKTYVVSPIVTITVVELRPLRVSVFGEVAKPGVYELDRGSGVLTAYAHREEIYVLGLARPGEPAPLRIRFRYAALAQGARPAAVFRLRNGDSVVVE